MPRPIDADELLQALRKAHIYAVAQGNDMVSGLEEACGYVEESPTIEAEPVRHGTWLWYSSTMMQCSACGRTVPRHRYKGCPHCRAKMSPLLGVKMDGGAGCGTA